MYVRPHQAFHPLSLLTSPILQAQPPRSLQFLEERDGEEKQWWEVETIENEGGSTFLGDFMNEVLVWDDEDSPVRCYYYSLRYEYFTKRGHITCISLVSERI